MRYDSVKWLEARLDLGSIYISPSGVVGGMAGTLLLLPLDDAQEISFLVFK